MIDTLLQAGDDMLDWFLLSVLAPVLAVLLDHPWLVGVVLVVVLFVIVYDTARQESDEEKANRLEGERVRQEVWGK